MSEKNVLPPNFEEWGDVEADADLERVRDLFFGKDKSEVVVLLDKAFVMRCLDLSIMPVGVFEYYVEAFVNYLLCGVEGDDSFGVLLKAFLSAVSLYGEYASGDSNKYWRVAVGHLDSMAVKLDAGQVDALMKSEIMQQLAEIRTAIQ